MRFVCDSCRAQYMISDEKVGAKGVKVRCKKCGFVILVRRAQDAAPPPPPAPVDDGVMATQVMQNPLTPASSDDEATVAGGPEITAPGVAGALVASEKNVAQAAAASQKGSGASFGGGVGGGSPFGDGGGGGIFAGVEEDEIGAVFDQVLNSGTHPVGSLVDGGNGAANGGSGSGGGGLGLGEETNDDRLSTRVLDAETVRKLAEEAAGEQAGGAKVVVSKGAAAEGEKHDWFVAINDAQVGPLTLEKMKGHWDAGEIGPDSLCWRAGFSDWMPVSEVAELAPVLAPQPKKPVIVGSGDEDDAPAVAPGPVESAFSARPRSITPAQVPAVSLAAPSGGDEDGGGWKPSAASALASLVKEEIEALARPPQPEPKPEPAPAAFAAVAPEPREEPIRGLLELPSEEHRIPDLGAEADAPSGAMPQAPAAAVASGGAAPRAGRADSQRRSRPAAPPPPAESAVPAAVAAQSGGLPRSMLIGGAVMLALVVVLVGAVLALAFRDREGAAPVAQAPQPPVQLAQAPVQPAQPAAAAPVPAAPVAATEPAKPAEPPAAAAEPAKAEAVAAAPAAAAAAAKSEEPAAKEETTSRSASSKRTEPAVARREEPATRQASTRPQAVAAAPAPREEPAARTTSPAEAADDFDAVFGGSKGTSSKKTAPASAKSAAAPSKGSDSVYIPPAPGTSTGPQRLGQSDIMAVVLQNKAAIQRCVTEQKNKDPSVTGTLVMQWSIRTSGSTEKISVQSAEFRSTHVATCMGGLIRGWRFPAHQEQGEPINFPFKF